MRENREAIDGDATARQQPKEPPPSPWRYSRAKIKLEGLLKDESSWIQLLTPFQIWYNDPLFKRYPWPTGVCLLPAIPIWPTL